MPAVTVVPRVPLGVSRRLRGPFGNAEWLGAVTACAVAAVLALFVGVMGWRGSDLPAQLFRVELFRRDGFVLWNSQWFGGHPTLDYSVLSPVLGAVTGPIALGAACGVASAFLFHRLVYRAFGASALVGSIWFATSTVTNLLVGRVTFALGLTFALGALFALQRGRGWIAASCALLCALASPVAGVFLAVAAGAWGFAQPSQRIVAWLTAAIAIVPVFAIALEFPSPGTQPYETWAFACDVALCALLWIAVPDRFAGLRWSAGLYALVLTGTYVFASPLGGNVSRLNQYAAGPLLACALWEYRRWIVAAIAIPLLFWQWFPTVDTIALAHNDPSIHRAYYEPLVDYLTPRRSPFGRLEIAETYRHWETAYVAPRLSLARGWERQLDYAYNGEFLAGTLTAAGYRSWLAENGVEYVALPDARLDSSSIVEAGLLERGQPYLEPVWRSAHWRVWRFSGYRGLVDGPAHLVSLAADSFTLQVTANAPVTVHIHASRHWAVSDDGCATASGDGWTQLHDLKVGEVRVTQALSGTPCDAN
jgi:hypothetical protein